MHGGHTGMTLRKDDRPDMEAVILKPVGGVFPLLVSPLLYEHDPLCRFFDGRNLRFHISPCFCLVSQVGSELEVIWKQIHVLWSKRLK